MVTRENGYGYSICCILLEGCFMRGFMLCTQIQSVQIGTDVGMDRDDIAMLCLSVRI